MISLGPIYVEAQKGSKTYTVEDEFSFKYPSNWELQERENRFTTMDAKLKYGNNDVQMIFEGLRTTDSPIASADDNSILEVMKTVIEGKNEANVFESGVDKYVINNRTAPYVIGTYKPTNLFGVSLNMVDMMTTVHVNDDEIVLVQYLAEQNDFDKYLPKVEEVIKSISPVGGDKLQSGST